MKLHAKSRPCLVTLVVEMNCLCPECDEPNDLLEIGESCGEGKYMLMTCGNCKYTFGVRAKYEEVLKTVDKLQEQIPCTLLSDDDVHTCQVLGSSREEPKEQTEYVTPPWPGTVALDDESKDL